ncbi:unnamed protein product [Ixodes pacificus]
MLEMPRRQVGTICVPKTAKGQSEREDNVSSRRRRVAEVPCAVPVDVSSQWRGDKRSKANQPTRILPTPNKLRNLAPRRKSTPKTSQNKICRPTKKKTNAASKRKGYASNPRREKKKCGWR